MQHQQQRALILLVCTVALAMACTVDNDCYSDSTTTPYCVQTSNNSPPSYDCRACRTDCDCSPGQFCVTDVTKSTMGSCQSIDSMAKRLGKPCTDVQNPILGTNDKSFCGYVSSYNNNTKNPEPYGKQWTGACIDGACQACYNGDTKCGSRHGWICIQHQWTSSWQNDFTARTLKGNVIGQSATALLVFFVFVFLEFHAVLIYRHCSSNPDAYSSMTEPIIRTWHQSIGDHHHGYEQAPPAHGSGNHNGNQGSGATAPLKSGSSNYGATP